MKGTHFVKNSIKIANRWCNVEVIGQVATSTSNLSNFLYLLSNHITNRFEIGLNIAWCTISPSIKNDYEYKCTVGILRGRSIKTRILLSIIYWLDFNKYPSSRKNAEEKFLFTNLMGKLQEVYSYKQHISLFMTTRLCQYDLIWRNCIIIYDY